MPVKRTNPHGMLVSQSACESGVPGAPEFHKVPVKVVSLVTLSFTKCLVKLSFIHCLPSVLQPFHLDDEAAEDPDGKVGDASSLDFRITNSNLPYLIFKYMNSIWI